MQKEKIKNKPFKILVVKKISNEMFFRVVYDNSLIHDYVCNQGYIRRVSCPEIDSGSVYLRGDVVSYNHAALWLPVLPSNIIEMCNRLTNEE